MDRSFLKGVVATVVVLYVYHHFIGAVPGGKTKAA
jgi:hypothetical protein